MVFVYDFFIDHMPIYLQEISDLLHYTEGGRVGWRIEGWVDEGQGSLVWDSGMGVERCRGKGLVGEGYMER